jgi:hypothetical protein
MRQVEEGSGRGLIKAVSRHLSVRLRKTMKTLSQCSQSPGRDVNPGAPEYKARVPTLKRNIHV